MNPPGDGTDVALVEGSPGDPSTPGRLRPRRLNLARPWSFPAGRPDFIHCRRHARSSVCIRVELVLYHPDGTLFDRGSAVIRDLSFSGARLAEVSLPQGRLLATYFGIGLRPALGSFVGPDISGRILRTFTPGMPGFGIEFLDPGPGAEERLRNFA